MPPVDAAQLRAPSNVQTGISQSDNIKVAVRIRPLNVQESASGVAEAVKVAQASCSAHCPRASLCPGTVRQLHART
jgi:hypothetical protein